MNTQKQRATTPAARRATRTPENTTRVCASTAAHIEHLAELHHLPPARVAGTWAEIGLELLADGERARWAGTTFDQLILQVIGREFPKARHTVPILISEWGSEVSTAWAKDFARPVSEWLGHMIEIGIKRYDLHDLVSSLLRKEPGAIFILRPRDIERDNRDAPGAEKLLRSAPAVPSALLAFERSLSPKGGKA